MKYHTIVIDPPWDIGSNNWSRFSGAHGKHGLLHTATVPYKTMSDKEIMEFPIDDFADDDCDLFMWVVHKKLRLSFEILDAWNFRYQSLITWIKDGGLTVNGVYRNTEFLLYGYKGKQQITYRKGIPCALEGKRHGHSGKPASVYQLLRTHTKSPRIDIFARRRHDGYSAWGNQVEKELQTTLTLD